MKEYMMLRHLVGVLALGALSVTQVQAATCSSPAEASVFDVAALKSMLMVMATGCSGDDTSYNAVINRYRPELVTNDAQLNEYFKKQFGPRNWQREHDAYITSLANAQADAGLKLGSDMCPRDAALFKEVMALRGPQDLPDYAAAKDLVPASLGSCVAPEPPARPAPRKIVHTTRKEH